MDYAAGSVASTMEISQRKVAGQYHTTLISGAPALLQTLALVFLGGCYEARCLLLVTLGLAGSSTPGPPATPCDPDASSVASYSFLTTMDAAWGCEDPDVFFRKGQCRGRISFLPRAKRGHELCRNIVAAMENRVSLAPYIHFLNVRII